MIHHNKRKSGNNLNSSTEHTAKGIKRRAIRATSQDETPRTKQKMSFSPKKNGKPRIVFGEVDHERSIGITKDHGLGRIAGQISRISGSCLDFAVLCGRHYFAHDLKGTSDQDTTIRIDHFHESRRVAKKLADDQLEQRFGVPMILVFLD